MMSQLVGKSVRRAWERDPGILTTVLRNPSNSPGTRWLRFARDGRARASARGKRLQANLPRTSQTRASFGSFGTAAGVLLERMLKRSDRPVPPRRPSRWVGRGGGDPIPRTTSVDIFNRNHPD